MKFSDIHVGHIYNVIFDPVRDCEFDGKHLSVVIKKNNDKATAIVIPLTSVPNGVGFNKLKIGSITALPSSLRSSETYASYNQIRTVNASRFIKLKEGDKPIQVKLPSEKFELLMKLAIEDLLFDQDYKAKISVLNDVNAKIMLIKAKDKAYEMVKLKGCKTKKEEVLVKLRQEIIEILEIINYNYELVDDSENFKKIIEEAIDIN